MIKKIIVIDDDQELCEEIAEILIEQSYKVSTFSDPLSGLDSLISNDYDLLLLDLKMPKVSGVKILKYIKDRDVKLPVFVFTGNPLNVDMIEEGGDFLSNQYQIIESADGVINKPFNIPELLSRIQQILNK